VPSSTSLFCLLQLRGLEKYYSNKKSAEILPALFVSLNS